MKRDKEMLTECKSTARTSVAGIGQDLATAVLLT